MTADAEPPQGHQPPGDSLKRQVRGSVLLVGGRGISILLNLCTQIVIVRYLSREDFGAWAWAISIIEAAAVLVACCMDKTFARFGAIYHEQGDRARLAGAFTLAVMTPLLASALLIAVAMLAQSSLAHALGMDTRTASFLYLMIWLVPLNTLASIVLSFLTVLQGARSVFFRKYLVAPALKFLLILLVLAYRGSPTQLAGALVLAGVAGLLIDGGLTARLLRSEGLLESFRPGRLTLPWREFFRYALGLSSADLAFLARGTFIVLMLGWLATADAAGEMRVILPVVKLNELVLVNFGLLFVPLASRLWTRDSLDELIQLYRKSRVWLVVLSFPVFAVCTCCAEPLITLLFGSAYRSAAPLLAVMSGGYFLQTLFGYNGQLLKVAGAVRSLVVADLAATVAAVTTAALWIPRFAATGAACAVVVGVFVHCGLKQITLCNLLRRTRTAGSHPPGDAQPSTSFRLEAIFVLAMLALLLLSLVAPPTLQQGVILASAVSVLVAWSARRELNPVEYFPELARLPVFGSHFGRIAKPASGFGNGKP